MSIALFKSDTVQINQAQGHINPRDEKKKDTAHVWHKNVKKK